MTATTELTPFIEQCDQDGDKQTWPRPVWHDARCGYCGKPVTFADGISIFSDLACRIAYPHQDSAVRAVLEHKGCGPDTGYWIEFRRLLRDGLDGPSGWLTHLRGKEWFHAGIAKGVQDAYGLAQRLAPKPEPVPLPSKPYVVTQRPSRVSTNPRSISTRTRTRIMERDGFKCRRCGAGPTTSPLVVDHIIPVAKGGTADESNLQTLCHPCNAGKSDRDPHDHDLRGRE